MTAAWHEIDQPGFERWLARMDEALGAFMARLPEEVRDRLDHTVASLDVLEAWLLERYPDKTDARVKREMPVLDGASRYVGETYRKYLGGRWTIRHDDPKYIFHALPILADMRSGGPDCPLTMVTASLARRRGDYISGYARRPCARGPWGTRCGAAGRPGH